MILFYFWVLYAGYSSLLLYFNALIENFKKTMSFCMCVFFFFIFIFYFYFCMCVFFTLYVRKPNVHLLGSINAYSLYNHQYVILLYVQALKCFVNFFIKVILGKTMYLILPLLDVLKFLFGKYSSNKNN